MNKKIGFPLLIISLSFLFFGCAAPKMYYWGDYSKSIYAYRKNPTEENLQKHKRVLEVIVERSQQDNLRVPPGVYAELGYIYFRENKKPEALKFFEFEEKLYPESRIFMQRLTQAAKAKGDGASVPPLQPEQIAGEAVKAPPPAEPKEIQRPEKPAPGNTEDPIIAGSVVLNLSLVKDAKIIQKRLADLGYYHSQVDGIWGKGSQIALKRFKEKNGLKNPEKWDPETQSLLFKKAE